MTEILMMTLAKLDTSTHSVDTDNPRRRSPKMVFSIAYRNKIKLEEIYTRIFKNV